MLKALACLVGIAAFGLLLQTGARAQSAADFFRGKQISLYIGYNPGGTYDIYARLVGGQLSRFLPGNPTIVPKNMPGVAGLKATTFLYAQAPRDGTAIGIAPQAIALEQAFRNPAAQYDARKFQWIGRITSIVESLVAWHSSPIKTIGDAKKREMVIAATSPDSTTETNPKLLNNLVGTKLKIVLGYPGITGSLLALERGEVEGTTAAIEDLVTGHAEWLRDKQVNVLVTYSQERHKSFPDVPAMVELARNPEDRQILALYGSIADVGRALMLPPEVPADRVAALRTAFESLMKDAAFRAEVHKANLEIDPVPGQEFQRRVEETLSLAPAVLERAARLRH